MIKDVLTAIQNKLKNLPCIKYVGEDWGQLDYYAERPPVNFPCVLFDLGEVDFTDKSQRAQEAVGTVTIRVSDYQLRNVSANGPDSLRAFEMVDTLNEVYKALQGLQGETFTGLTRKKTAKVRRDDGIREFEMTFKFSYTDNEAMKKRTPLRPDARIDIN